MVMKGLCRSSLTFHSSYQAEIKLEKLEPSYLSMQLLRTLLYQWMPYLQLDIGHLLDDLFSCFSASKLYALSCLVVNPTIRMNWDILQSRPLNLHGLVLNRSCESRSFESAFGSLKRATFGLISSEKNVRNPRGLSFRNSHVCWQNERTIKNLLFLVSGCFCIPRHTWKDHKPAESIPEPTYLLISNIVFRGLLQDTTLLEFHMDIQNVTVEDHVRIAAIRYMHGSHVQGSHQLEKSTKFDDQSTSVAALHSCQQL